MTDMDDLVEWLGRTLDEIERVATEATDHAYGAGDFRSWSWDDWGLAGQLADAGNNEDWAVVRAAHIHAHDPRAVLARVQAERLILQSFRDAAEWSQHPSNSNPEAYARMAGTTLDALRSLAWGHRYDLAGWRADWAPEGASETLAP